MLVVGLIRARFTDLWAWIMNPRARFIKTLQIYTSYFFIMLELPAADFSDLTQLQFCLVAVVDLCSARCVFTNVLNVLNA